MSAGKALLRHAEDFLDVPEEHLPPREFVRDEAFLLTTPAILKPGPLARWQEKHREAFEQCAARAMREKSGRMVERWEEGRGVLRDLLALLKKRKGRGRGRKEHSLGRVELSAQAARAEAYYDFRCEVLHEAETALALPEPPGATEPADCEDRKLVNEFFDGVPELTGYDAPGYVREAYAALDPGISSGRQLAGRIGDRRADGNAKVKTIKRGTGYDALTTEQKREGGWPLLKALIRLHGRRMEGESVAEPPRNVQKMS